MGCKGYYTVIKDYKVFSFGRRYVYRFVAAAASRTSYIA